MYPYVALGGISISTYFLLISVASIIGSLWFLKRAKRHELSALTAIDFNLIGLVAGFVGARLLHIYLEEPEYYREHPWHQLHLWNGGFVFLGGLIGGLIGTRIFCLLRREPFLLWADLAVLPLSLSYAIGRVACFLNGCCYGTHCELPWAVIMSGDTRHPTQLYATGIEFMLLFGLLRIERHLKVPGTLLGLWLILHSLGRLMMEMLREDPRGAPIHGLSLGIWMSAGLIVAGIALLLSLPRLTSGPRVAKL